MQQLIVRRSIKFLYLCCGSKGLRKMLIAFLRYLHAWRQYGMTVRELSSLSDRELADLGITRSDIPHVAWEQPRNTP
jgi:uncharacterized protein YjiS (DUF1127 family)